MMGGFVESLNLAFVYESIYTRSEYEQIRQSGFDYQPLLWRTHILTDCPDDDANYEKDENAGTGVAAKRLSKFPLFHGCGGSSRGAHADGTITQLLPEIGTK